MACLCHLFIWGSSARDYSSSTNIIVDPPPDPPLESLASFSGQSLAMYANLLQLYHLTCCKYFLGFLLTFFISLFLLFLGELQPFSAVLFLMNPFATVATTSFKPWVLSWILLKPCTVFGFLKEPFHLLPILFRFLVACTSLLIFSSAQL